MKKLCLIILMLYAYPSWAVDVTALPDLGDPATADDSLVTYDYSASEGSRITERKFSGNALHLLDGDAVFRILADGDIPAAITRDTEWDTFAEINAASTDTDAVLDTDIGSTVQAYSAVLDTYAGIDPSANMQEILGAANYAAMKVLLDLEAGTDFYSISAADAAFEGELTNSAGLAAALSDETGTGSAVFSSSPTLVTPALGTPSALVGTNISGTAASLTAGAVTGATLTTALTVNTGTVTLTGNAANNSALTIGAGAVGVSGSS